MGELTVIEHNGVDHALCPNCSRYYAVEENVRYEDGARRSDPLEVPSTCRRCGSPMDTEKARAYADKQAAEYGKGLRVPPRRVQVTTAATK